MSFPSPSYGTIPRHRGKGAWNERQAWFADLSAVLADPYDLLINCSVTHQLDSFLSQRGTEFATETSSWKLLSLSPGS